MLSVASISIKTVAHHQDLSMKAFSTVLSGAIQDISLVNRGGLAPKAINTSGLVLNSERGTEDDYERSAWTPELGV
jgi:hypothetical protein